MKAYFDESMNIALAMSAVALAVIVYSDNFEQKMAVTIIGLCLIITAICIPVISSIDFIQFVRSVEKDKLPPSISKTSLFSFIILCYTYFGLMALVAILFLFKKIVKKISRR